MIGLIGRKLGMTQVFTERGVLLPVTVLEAGPCPVVQVKTDAADGYRAAQLGFQETKERKLTKPERGHLTRHGVGPMRLLREFRLPAGEELKKGDTLTVQQLEVGSRVDVISTSKGKGFQGVVKRHHFSGGPASHGSKTGDMPGSVGSSAWPSHVFKGRRLPGQMGNKRCTVRNLRVVKIDADRNLVLVEGSVPGGSNTFVVIRPAVTSQKAKETGAGPGKKG
jgi:large subunit ribosomal protein L3